MLAYSEKVEYTFLAGKKKKDEIVITPSTLLTIPTPPIKNLLKHAESIRFHCDEYAVEQEDF